MITDFEVDPTSTGQPEASLCPSALNLTTLAPLVGVSKS
jgi:hypothetical protein